MLFQRLKDMLVWQVCEDYRDREHILQPTALRPDFEIVPHDHLKEGARVLAPHSDGLWYSARVFVTTGDDVLRTRNKLNVRSNCPSIATAVMLSTYYSLQVSEWI